MLVGMVAVLLDWPYTEDELELVSSYFICWPSTGVSILHWSIITFIANLHPFYNLDGVFRVHYIHQKTGMLTPMELLKL